MAKKTQSSFVLSVGGSLLIGPDGPDYRFIKKFCNFIKNQVKLGYKFYLVVGGGLTARSYIKAAGKIAQVSAADRDWVGIQATRLNAELLRAIFGPEAYPTVVINPRVPFQSRQPIVVAAGYRPGFSTDHCSVLLARSQGLDTIINLSNIDYVYDQDPRANSQARPLASMSWAQFRKIVGDQWRPGLNVPFDPIAAQSSQRHGLKAIIVNGRKLENLSQCLRKKSFKGTIIS